MNQLKASSLNVHILGGIAEQRSPLSFTGGTVCISALGTPQDIGTRALTSDPPPTPTSRRSKCDVLHTYYTAIYTLKDNMLLVFNLYRLNNERN